MEPLPTATVSAVTSRSFATTSQALLARPVVPRPTTLMPPCRFPGGLCRHPIHNTPWVTGHDVVPPRFPVPPQFPVPPPALGVLPLVRRRTELDLPRYVSVLLYCPVFISYSL